VQADCSQQKPKLQQSAGRGMGRVQRKLLQERLRSASNVVAARSSDSDQCRHSAFRAAMNGKLAIAGERQSGQDVRTQNVTAVSAIANIVKSSLGPVGLDKVGLAPGLHGPLCTPGMASG
jgi:CHASE1-domain containing sensor protein